MSQNIYENFLLNSRSDKRFLSDRRQKWFYPALYIRIILISQFMKIRHTITVLLCLMLSFSTMAIDNVYAVGGFNNWDALAPRRFIYSEGLYKANIDFSSSNEFKLSTTRGSDGNGWNQFDEGTMVYTGNPVVGEWLPLQNQPTSGNLKAPSRSKLTVVVDLDNMMLKFEESSTTTAWSGTLPVMFINTENGTPVTDKETYINATYYIDPMGDPNIEALGSADSPLETQIKGRGNYTWIGFEKKPYRLKFVKKASPLGMPSSRHFVLLAHADDNMGFMRNECGFTASKLLGMPWTPESLPIELVMNGDYKGLYFLTQNIRVSSDRVDIVEQDDLATTEVDGGWLIEIDNYDSDPHVTVYENGNQSQPIWFTYKSPEELSQEQSSYLQSQMNAIDNAVYSSDKSGNSTLAELVDFDILARYYITQEIVDDTESFHGSCYLNRNRGEAEKWKFGPVWDFGTAFERGASTEFIWQNPKWHQVWIGEIYKFPEFVKKVKEIWSQYLYEGPEMLTEHIKQYADRITVAAQYDALRWPDYGNPDVETKSEEVISLINKKTDWLKSQWGSQAGITDLPVADGALPVDIYNMQGICVLRQATPDRIEALPPGIYISRGKKFIKRQ